MIINFLKKVIDILYLALLLYLHHYVLCIYCNIPFCIKMLTVRKKYFDIVTVFMI